MVGGPRRKRDGVVLQMSTKCATSILALMKSILNLLVIPLVLAFRLVFFEDGRKLSKGIIQESKTPRRACRMQKIKHRYGGRMHNYLTVDSLTAGKHFPSLGIWPQNVGSMFVEHKSCLVLRRGLYAL